MLDAVNLDELERGIVIPSRVTTQFSDTSEAYLCFSEQKFSAKLQAQMVNYVATISGVYSVYA